jgi:hypothetical protein
MLYDPKWLVPPPTLPHTKPFPKIATETLCGEWLARLRAGTEGQTRFQYTDDEKHFCAVGLLHHLVMEKGVSDGDAEKVIYKYFGARMLSKIMVLNDSGKTFSEIAELIEKMSKRQLRQ